MHMKKYMQFKLKSKKEFLEGFILENNLRINLERNHIIYYRRKYYAPVKNLIFYGPLALERLSF